MAKKKKKSSMLAGLRPEFVVIDVDISGEQSIDTTALEIMESLKGCVSKDLFELLKAMLLGFNGDILLEACYRWIADEQGLIRRGF